MASKQSISEIQETVLEAEQFDAINNQENQQNDYIVQLIASNNFLEQVSGSSDDTLDATIEKFEKMKLDIALKQGYVKMEKTKPVVKAKQAAKAREKAMEKEEEKPEKNRRRNVLEQ